MGLKTGLTDRTITSLQLNAGVLVKTYSKGVTIDADDIIGATRGGGSFSAIPTVHQVAVDGAPTYVKGLERIDDWVVTLNFGSFLEFTAESLAMALGVGVKKSANESSDTILTAEHSVNAGDYQDIYWIGDLSNGKNVVIHLKNCLNLAGLTITATDRGEGTYPLTFTAHYDVDNINEAPFNITLEK